MTVEAILQPRGPYSLRLSAGGSDATRSVRDGVVSALVALGDGCGRVEAWQRPDGRIVARGESAEAIDRLRFALALDDDHSEFIRRFRDDHLVGRATRELRGLRPARVATVAHALLRALCGQLITSREARAIERRVIRAVTPSHDGLHAPPTARDLGRLSPAALRELGLHARRGATLVRICRSLDLERLHALPTAAVAERLGRERGLGPWSVGVVCLEGLGRRERGLARDLGLVKLLSALRGRWVDAAETDELLEPYGDWAGLASVYLLAGFSRGLIPGCNPASQGPVRGVAAVDDTRHVVRGKDAGRTPGGRHWIGATEDAASRRVAPVRRPDPLSGQAPKLSAWPKAVDASRSSAPARSGSRSSPVS